MPDFTSYTKRQLEFALREIRDAVYTIVGELDIHAWCTHEPLPFAERCNGEPRDLSVGDKWGDLFDSAWFHFIGEVPQAVEGEHVVLLLDVNGEMCVFDDDGVPIRGLTPVASTYDMRLGGPGKRVLQVTPCADGGELIGIWADAGCNDLFGRLQGDGRIRQAAIAVCNDEMRALYYDFEVLWDLMQTLPEESPRYHQILRALNDAVHMLYPLLGESLDPAWDESSSSLGKVSDRFLAGATSSAALEAKAVEVRAILAPMLSKRGGDPSLKISAIGHAHMDLAWLWPIRETIRKGARTFSTVLALMDRYPDYVFGASQPQYFVWMQEHYPELYAKIKEKVLEGRIEPQGAMWVEADMNISGGEALVRQLLHGKRFFKQEFDVEIDYLWLPDVFGYNAALPQILKKAGVDYFSTQKLSWSLINTFPHHSFHWQGIDGTSVLTHMLPEETYNSPAAPRSVRKIEENYKDKGVSDHGLMVFGIGDGGGGPGAEHLERLDRIKNLAGLSPVTQESVADFFKKWEKDAVRFPTWVGELYLERHEGTLTTEARNKWYNRKMELALRELEWLSVLAGLAAGAPYPAERLEAIWREVLLYQFHDILPGSSIKRVYDESLARYAEMLQEVKGHIEKQDAALAALVDTEDMKEPVMVHNALSWERTEWVQIKDVAANTTTWRCVTVPAMGYKVVDMAEDDKGDLSSLTAAETDGVYVLENNLLRVQFGPDGSIVSIYDKDAACEVIPEGKVGNRLAVYVDLGDAWDFPMDYAEQAPRYMSLVSATPRVDGPQAILEQVYRIGHSELVQEVILTAGSRRLDFVSRLHWLEPRTMLRTSFPIAVHAEEATFEIQYGHIQRPTHRNTTWDLARDEVVGHKWVDLSQRDYGVALLNDCKYGHKVKGNVLDLNLLRSVPYPGARVVEDSEVEPGEPHHAYTDQCEKNAYHHFTYALYPHSGDYVQGGVIRAGYALNVPLRVVPVEVHEGSEPREASFLEIDAENVIIEAVKKAEDNDDIIIRLYEAEHKGTSATLCFGFPVKSVVATNLMEEVLETLDVEDGTVALTFKPFEIKTLRVKV
jgi:alpha-mannosidase